MLELFEIVCDSKSTYYKNHGQPEPSPRPKSGKKGKSGNQNAATAQPQPQPPIRTSAFVDISSAGQSPVSLHLLSFLNVFGEAKGFEALASSLANRTLPLPLTLQLLRACSTLQPLLRLDFSSDFVLRVSSNLNARFDGLSDDEVRTLSGEAVSCVCSQLFSMLSAYTDANDASEFCEKLAFGLFSRLFSSAQFDARKQGLDMLGVKIDLIITLITLRTLSRFTSRRLASAWAEKESAALLRVKTQRVSGLRARGC
jgi:hypothetical protein